MHTITLSSFVEARQQGGESWAGSRTSPGFASEWPVLDPVRPLRNGKPVLIRHYGGDIHAYYKAVANMIVLRSAEIADWYDHLEGPVNLCCWCPHTRKATEQMQAYGSFVCHLGSVAKVLDYLELPWKYSPKIRAGLARVTKGA